MSETYGQSYKFRNFSLQDGLADPFIYSIDQDSSGYLWIGTGEGLMRYDGKSFREYSSVDLPSKSLVTASHNYNGSIIFGFDDGTLVELLDGESRLIIKGENVGSRINSIRRADNGKYVIATQDQGVIMISETGEVEQYRQGIIDDLLYDVLPMEDGQLLLASSDGVKLVDPVKLEETNALNSISDVEAGMVSAIARLDNQTFIAGSQEFGLVRISLIDDHLVMDPILSEVFTDVQIRSIRVDNQRNVWVSTFGKGLVKIAFGEDNAEADELVVYDSDNGLRTEFVQLTFEDREGHVWVGTYGSGLSYLVDEYFLFYFDKREGVVNSVTSILIEDSVKLFGVGKELRKIRPSKNPPFMIFDERHGLPEDELSSIRRSKDGRLWLGYKNSGLYTFNETSGMVKRIPLGTDDLSNSINEVLVLNNSVYVATFDGLYVLDFSGQPLRHYGTQEGLRHNTIYCLEPYGEDGVWIGTTSNTLSRLTTDGEYKEFTITKGEQLISIVSITSDDRGMIWLATESNGVVRFDPATKQVKAYSERNGLLSNHGYGVEIDGKGRVWIGHRAGLSRIDPIKQTIQIYDSRYGLLSENNQNAVAADDNGNVWFGTLNGLIKYDPSKDKGLSIPPGIDIQDLAINDELIDKKKGVLELDYQEYEFTFYFRAITFSSPEGVSYFYKLEGHDRDWVKAGNATFASYNKLYDGKYTFKVRACNISGACAEKTFPVTIVIDKPYWKKWWFYLLMVLGMVIVVATVAFFRERNLRKVKLYLEDQLNFRTKEVVQQKEIIEEKNKNITDSINYAQRIQEAMLPDDDEFKVEFPDSFLINRPRDIVSGDFYWFSRKGDKVLVACADCTGHGVPGALMSMIGSVALRNIVIMPEISSPSDMLYELDNEVNSVLKQDLGANDFMSTKDGMDITICEIDTNTNLVRMAAAMRNSIMIIDGRLELFRGDRWAIGGAKNDKKVFSTQEFELKAGDSIIMFSDGYIDQFGGEEGKKIKMNRLMEVIENSGWNNMAELKLVLEKTLDDWQGDYDQMDDILVVGFTL